MSDEKNYNVFAPATGVPIKAWTKGVPLEEQARKQLLNVAQLPFIFKWVAPCRTFTGASEQRLAASFPRKEQSSLPPLCGHWLRHDGRTDGFETRAICDHLKGIRSEIEKAVPHGRTNHGGRGDAGAWREIPLRNNEVWQTLKPRYDAILEKHRKLDRGNHSNHLGTLGTGNHFIEVWPG